MFRRSTRLRIAPDGSLEVIDPDSEALHVLQAIDPEFTVRREPLKGFKVPRLMHTRDFLTGITSEELSSLSTRSLWEVHDAFLSDSQSRGSRKAASRQVSLLDVKIELARRELSSCGLCHHRCKVNRLAGERGVCGLGAEAYVGEHFLHIAEEASINPSYNLNLQGCALRCQYCQQYRLLLIRPRLGRKLDASLWHELDLSAARSLSFVGGNPDESIYAILRFLKHAPKGLELPVVWNCHGYAEAPTLKLLDGVVDVYVPDFKYGSEACARKWSGVSGYVKTVRANIRRMVSQEAFVIVRMLVLPGHFDCCHRPALRFLSRYRDRLQVNVLRQYCPDFMVRPSDGPIASRPPSEEVQAVIDEAKRCGLELVS